eukprot:210343-Karenia_brevis.AAC.1
MRWVDTNKRHMKGKYDVRSRMVAKNYKGGDKGRDDLFAEPPPLEAKRMLFSRAETMREDGKSRKLFFIDVKKGTPQPIVRRGCVSGTSRGMQFSPRILW